MKKVYVYDIECLYDFFCIVFKEYKGNEKTLFEISNFKNDLKEIKQFIQQNVKGWWGYNNNEYDDVVMDWLLSQITVTANDIYQFSTSVIESKERQWVNMPFPSADIYRMLHFNRFHVSLKWCQFMMQSRSIEESPVGWDESIIDRKIADGVIDYCIWDVCETEKVILAHPEELELRGNIFREYPKFHNPYSMSNTAIGKASMLSDYCDETGENYWDVKERRTLHNTIYPKDVIDERISFKTEHFQNFHQRLLNSNVNLVNKSLNEHFEFQGMHYHLAKGGLHGTEGVLKKAGSKYTVDTRYIYESKDGHTLLDADFGSYYPYLMQRLRIAPEHLNTNEFLDLLGKYTEERIYHKKSGNKIKATALKLKINSIYGLLGDQHSFLYDLKAMYKVTLNGQLLLLMLIEQMAQHGYKCWYANTDGASFLVPDEDMSFAQQVLNEFSQWINIILETEIFQKAYIRDVNNFCIIKKDGSLKLKGAYVYENLPLNKNASNLISKKAAVQHLVNSTQINEIISNEKSIHPFCIGFRARATPKKGRPDLVWFKDGDRENAEIQQKTIRYIITKGGGVLKLVYEDGSETHKESHPHKGQLWFTTILNRIESDNRYDYNIDESYYIREALKLCDFRITEKQAYVNQLSLF